MRTTAFLSASLALAGCGDNLPPTDDSDPPIGDQRTITGSQVVAFRHLDGTVLSESPIDLWTTVIEMHVPDGDGWRVVPGTGHRDGSFEIEGVPDGEAWLRVARRPFGEAFYWTAADHVSFDESVLGAEDPPSANEGDQLVLSVDGLAAWQDGDELAWFVPDDDVFSNNLLSASPPALDTTAIDGVGVDWTLRPLANATAGDAAHLVQYRTQELAPGIALRAPLRAAQPTLQQQAGVDGTLTATLSAPEPLRYHLAWARDAFEAERTAAHPTRAGASVNHGFALTAFPAHVDGELWLGVEYVVANLADPSVLDGPTPDLGEVDIPNPYPRSWLADLYVVTFPVEFPLPDGSPATLEAVLGRRSTALTEAGPATPLVTAIRAPKIGGRDAFVEQRGVGTTPEIRWQPPATGTPTSYMLQIIEGLAEPPPAVPAGLVRHRAAVRAG